MPDVYSELLRPSDARRFVATGFVGRLPMAMLGLATVLLVSRVTGSFGIAGAVSATMLLSQAITAPRIAREADRRGQATLLQPVVLVHGSALVAMVGAAALEAPVWVLFATGAVAGGSFPPIGSLVRARWSARLAGTGRLPAAFALESALDELAYVLGPLLVSALVWVWYPGAGLLCAAAVTVLGGMAFASQRSTQPPVAADGRSSRSVLRCSGMRVLVTAAVGLGALIGSTELGLVGFAAEQGRPLAAGPLLALFSVGSILAGLAYGTWTWRAPLAHRLGVSVGALLVSTVPIAASPALLPMTISVFLAGFAFSPVLIIAYELVQELLPAAALNEGFAWLQTALGAGLAVGAASCGAVVDLAGARTALLLPLAAGTSALAVALVGREALAGAPAGTSAG